MLLVAAVSLGGLSSSPAAAVSGSEGAEGELVWSATINGRDVRDIDRNDPLVLSSAGSTSVVVTMENSGSDPVRIRAVRLEGRVMNMTFFRYTTRLDVVLAPQAPTERQFELDLDDLTGQAVGLIPARFQILDDQRAVVAEEGFPIEVKGSLASVYGVFGLAVAGITAVLLALLLAATFRRTLPANRWKRAVRFLAVGAGIGLTLTFTLSATRQLTPSAAAWLSLVAVCAGGAFLLGYFLPLGASSDTEDDRAQVVEGEDDLVTNAHPQGVLTDTDRSP
ncbi:MAG: hypothetical protein ACRDP9_08380 [Kribbellaceae bacterium]